VRAAVFRERGEQDVRGAQAMLRKYLQKLERSIVTTVFSQLITETLPTSTDTISANPVNAWTTNFI
jgi:hypothetical protein